MEKLLHSTFGRSATLDSFGRSVRRHISACRVLALRRRSMEELLPEPARSPRRPLSPASAAGRGGGRASLARALACGRLRLRRPLPRAFTARIAPPAALRPLPERASAGGFPPRRLARARSRAAGLRRRLRGAPNGRRGLCAPPAARGRRHARLAGAGRLRSRAASLAPMAPHGRARRRTAMSATHSGPPPARITPIMESHPRGRLPVEHFGRVIPG